MIERKIPRSAGAPEGRKGALTRARLSWLSDCSLVHGITASELKLAMQFALNFAGQPDSEVLFGESGLPICWPPQALLSERLGISRQAIQQAAARLAARGLLRITPGGGRGRATEYELMGNGKQPTCRLAAPKQQASTDKKASMKQRNSKPEPREKASKLLAPIRSHQSSNSIHSKSGSDVGDASAGVRKLSDEEAFDELFKIWPNKTDLNYGKAHGAWNNYVVRNEKVSANHVLKRAKLWVRHWKNKGSFIPYLGKWLKDSGWRYEPTIDPEERLLDGYFDMIEKASQNIDEVGADEDGVVVRASSRFGSRPDRPIRDDDDEE